MKVNNPCITNKMVESEFHKTSMSYLYRNLDAYIFFDKFRHEFNIIPDGRSYFTYIVIETDRSRLNRMYYFCIKHRLND